jgi:hypothetical protein
VKSGLLVRRSRPLEVAKMPFNWRVVEKRACAGVKRSEQLKWRTVMTKPGLIGLALLLVLATPAMAMHARHHHYGYFHALKFHFGSTYAAYNFYQGYDFARRNNFN